MYISCGKFPAKKREEREKIRVLSKTDKTISLALFFYVVLLTATSLNPLIDINKNELIADKM